MSRQLTAPQLLRRDQREISYRHLGEGRRRILFFHGFPGSSIQIELFRLHLEHHGLEVLCVDRPGYHRTEAIGGDQFAQTLDVVTKVLEAHAWSDFEIVSVSGGTPFAFHVARALGARVRQVTVICGLGPVGTSAFHGVLSGTSITSLKLLPWLPGRPLKSLMTRVANDHAGKRPWFFSLLMPVSGADRECMSDPSLTVSLQQGLRESVEQNGLGPQLDARAFLSEWSYELPQLRGSVAFWHGEEDRLIPPRMARLAHDKVANSKLVFVPGEGHYSLPIRQMGRILSETAF